MDDQAQTARPPEGHHQNHFPPNPPFQPPQTPWTPPPQGIYQPPPMMYPPYPGMPPFPLPPPDHGRDLAIAGFVLGLVSIFSWATPCMSIPVPVLGIIFSAIGCRSITRKGLSIAGLILSIFGLLIEIAFFALTMAPILFR